MELKCPFCHLKNSTDCLSDRNILKAGSFYRTSDRKRVQRYVCTRCRTHFCSSTLHDCYRQKKRHYNAIVSRQLVAGTSFRETARVLGLNRKTVARKANFMAARARFDLRESNLEHKKATLIQFDEIETFEHTKCKPVSIHLAIEAKTRRILDFQISRMPAKGLLTKKSLRLYGKREDGRSEARKTLLNNLKELIEPFAEIKTDDNPHYPQDVKRHFPECTHIRIKGGRSCSTGQGELKKVGWDPIFSFNHTAANSRYRMSRLIRKTWCTTKSIQGLKDHFALFVLHHNRCLTI